MGFKYSRYVSREELALSIEKINKKVNKKYFFIIASKIYSDKLIFLFFATSV